MAVLGVDLGTAYARAAVTTHKAPIPLQLSDGSRALPAVVAYQKGTVLVGRAALGKAAMRPEITVRGVKRLLGRAPTDPLVAAIAQYASYGIQPREGGAMTLLVDGEPREPEDVAAAILSHLADTAREQIGVRPTAAVLTTPYWFGPRQRRALADAAARAGLETRQITSEGMAIALSLAADERAQRRIAVADVGAGGTTVSILELGPERVVLLSCTGDPVGGGDDIDRGLLRAVLKGFKARFGDFPDQPAINEMIRQTCEAMKRDLGVMARARAVIPFLPVGPTGVHHQEVSVDRQRFEMLIADTLARVEAACRNALAQARLEPKDLDSVYATGGVANVPAVRAVIERVLGTITSRKLDPDGAVAIGAALQASMLAGEIEPIPIVDVQSASIPPRAPTPSIPPVSVRTVPPPPARNSTPPRRPMSSRPPPPAEAPISADAFRLELATLLASVRAGAVTEGGRAAAKQMVVRANEAIDEDDLFDAERRAEMAVRLQGVWKQLALAMQAMRQYRWDHPQTTRHLESAMREIEQAFRFAPRSVRFDVGSSYFAYDRTPVFRPERPPMDRVPHQLFADGLRRVQFKEGLAIEELREFLSVLIGAASGFAADDDAVTALWEKRFVHIAHLAVDAFAEADDPAFEADRDELAGELARMTGVDADLDAALGSFFAGQREAVDQAAAIAIPEATRSALAAGAQLDAAAYEARQLAAFPSAFREAEREGDLETLTAALDAYAAERIAVGDVDALFAQIGKLTASFAAREGGGAATAMERQLTQAMLPKARIEAIFRWLAEATVTSETAHAIARSLDLVGDPSISGAAWEAYWSGAGGLREPLLPYLLRAASGHEDQLAKLAREGEVEHALAALKQLAELATPTARAAIHEAFQSAHLEVRIAAITHLPDASAEMVRVELTKLFEDPAPEVRVRALGVVGKLGAAAAGPVLVRRIQSGDLGALPVAERKLLLETLAQLNPRRAEEIAIDLLGKTQVLPSQGPEETRAIAAAVLGTMSSAEALEAVRNAAKKRWWNTAPVREAALAAEAAISARRGASAKGAT